MEAQLEREALAALEHLSKEAAQLRAHCDVALNLLDNERRRCDELAAARNAADAQAASLEARLQAAESLAAGEAKRRARAEAEAERLRAGAAGEAERRALAEAEADRLRAEVASLSGTAAAGKRTIEWLAEELAEARLARSQAVSVLGLQAETAHAARWDAQSLLHAMERSRLRQPGDESPLLSAVSGRLHPRLGGAGDRGLAGYGARH